MTAYTQLVVLLNDILGNIKLLKLIWINDFIKLSESFYVLNYTLSYLYLFFLFNYYKILAIEEIIKNSYI
jgi:hypothetical protein